MVTSTEVIGLLLLACAWNQASTAGLVDERAVTSDKSGEPSVLATVTLPRLAYAEFPCAAVVRLTISQEEVKKREQQLKNCDERTRILTRLIHDIESRLPVFDLGSTWPPVGVEIRDAASGRLEVQGRVPDARAYSVLDPKLVAHPVGRDAVSFADRGTCSFLLDIGNSIRHLAPGMYSVMCRVYPGDESRVWEAAPVRLVIGERPKGKLLELAKGFQELATEKDPIGPLTAWKSGGLDTAMLARSMPKEIMEQVSLYCFLNGAKKQGKVARAPLSLLDRVLLYLKPMADVMRYEVLKARGAQEAAELRKTLAKDHPELMWKIERVDAGKGVIAELLGDAKKR
jgi:hypothetical protein